MDIEFALTIIIATLILGIIFLILLFAFYRKWKLTTKFSKLTFWNALPYLLILYFVMLGLFFPVLLYQTLPSAIAGLFGIIMGFWLNESARLRRRKEQAKQLLKAIKEELQYNFNVASRMENDIEKEDVTFQTFKTNIWESFGSRLEVIENFQLAIRLSILYHKLLDVANVIRYNAKEIEEKGVGDILTPVLDEEPLEGIKRVKDEIEDLISAIRAELK
jgi:energy-coupling factor transporter transmembrane protein EcfT